MELYTAWLLQGAGLVAVNLAAYDFVAWNVGSSLLGLKAAFLGPQAKRMTVNVWGQPAFPLSLTVSIAHSSKCFPYMLTLPAATRCC